MRKFISYDVNKIKTNRPISSQIDVDPSRAKNIFVLSKFLARTTSISVHAVEIRHLFLIRKRQRLLIADKS
jgi:hypothetical protein